MPGEQQEPLHVWTIIGEPLGHPAYTYRMRVPGGWLYRYGNAEPAVVFVPDPRTIVGLAARTPWRDPQVSVLVERMRTVAREATWPAKNAPDPNLPGAKEARVKAAGSVPPMVERTAEAADATVAIC